MRKTAGTIHATSPTIGGVDNSTRPISDPDHLRVVIVGGGVTGLTLANALEVCVNGSAAPLLADRLTLSIILQKADIDYVLLERRSDMAPQVGASIGILPNGARVSVQCALDPLAP